MKTRHHAAPLVEGPDRVNAAAKPDVQVQPLGSRVFTQLDQGVVMAGVHGQHMAARVEGHGKGFFKLGLQRADLWCQTGLGLAFGPQHLVCKGGQSRGLSLFPDDQGLAQLCFPTAQLAPHVAV